MAYNSNLPTDDEFIAAGPADIRENFRALKEDQIVDAGTLAGLSAGNASGNIPESNGIVNTNLNADRLDGYEASAFSPASHSHSAATTSSAGFMSAADKTKIDGLASGAEINQNAFSNVQVGSTTIQADSKTDTLEFVAGTNISLAPDATNDRVTINVNGTVENAATAAKAVKLAAPVTINGVSFDGSGSITVADSSKAPIQHASTGTTYGVATSSNYGHAMASSATPLGAGTANAGTDNGKFAREGHVHPAQTTLGGFTPSQTAGAVNRIVVANSNGYIINNWFNSNRGAENTTAESYIYDSGDGFFRKKTVANVKAELGISNASYVPIFGNGAGGSFTASGGETLQGMCQYTNFTIPTGVTVNVGEVPLEIRCTGTITIAGTLNGRGNDGTESAGPGAGRGGGGRGGDGVGGEEGMGLPGGTGTGGGAGGNGSGAGGNSYMLGTILVATSSGTPSSIIADFMAYKVPFAAGGGGGGGHFDPGGGGGGGTVVLIGKSVTNSGSINVAGGGVDNHNGANNACGGGGGGGASIRIYAPTILLTGAIDVGGGTGGNGDYSSPTPHGGGNGWYRIITI